MVTAKKAHQRGALAGPFGGGWKAKFGLDVGRRSVVVYAGLWGWRITWGS